jgi:hypothetical protein
MFDLQNWTEITGRFTHNGDQQQQKKWQYPPCKIPVKKQKRKEKGFQGEEEILRISATITKTLEKKDIVSNHSGSSS